MRAGTHYRSFEDFERDELWSSDVSGSKFAGLDDDLRPAWRRDADEDDDDLQELDFG